MTLTTHIRFLEPVDPRLVWEMVSKLVNAPKPFEVEKYRAGDPVWEGARSTWDNAGWHAAPDQGADALIWMFYGQEGSLLVSELEDGVPINNEPPAYVELCLDTPYGCGVDHQPWIAEVLAWSPVAAVWNQGEIGPHWFPKARLSARQAVATEGKK